MALFEQLESGLAFVVTLLKFLLESIAVFCILLGVIKTGQIAISLNRHQSQNAIATNPAQLWNLASAGIRVSIRSRYSFYHLNLNL